MAMVTAAIITDVTVVTTSIDRSVMRGGWVAGSTFIVGSFLLALSTPSLTAYFLLAQNPSSVARALKTGRALPEPVLSRAIQIYEGAASSFPSDAVIQQDLGRLELRRLELALTPDQRRSVLLAASARFRASIVRAPSRVFPWSLEAYTQSELSAPPGEISRLLQMSYFLGPHEPSSMLLRVRTGSRNWSGLSTDVRKFVIEDFAEIWRMTSLRPTLIDIYLEGAMDVRTVIRRAAFKETDDLKRFDRLIFNAVSSVKSR